MHKQDSSPDFLIAVTACKLRKKFLGGVDWPHSSMHFEASCIPSILLRYIDFLKGYLHRSKIGDFHTIDTRHISRALCAIMRAIPRTRWKVWWHGISLDRLSYQHWIRRWMNWNALSSKRCDASLLLFPGNICAMDFNQNSYICLFASFYDYKKMRASYHVYHKKQQNHKETTCDKLFMNKWPTPTEKT